MFNVPDLQPIAADTGKSLVVEVLGKADLQPPVASPVWISDESTFYQLNAKCQDFITRYLGRSLITPDDPNMILVNRKLLRLAFAVSILHRFCQRRGQSSANSWLTVPFLNARLSGCGIYI